MYKLVTSRLNTFKQKQFYKTLIKKDDLCFDIGANIGYKSKLFLSLEAKVIALEPQSSCVKYLKKIKSRKFQFLPYAVGSKNEIKKLRLANHIEVATFSDQFIDYFKNDNLSWENFEMVTVKRLNTIIDEFGIPDFCKIDAEGYELEILSNLNYTIPIIEFEFTGGFILNTIEIIKLLNKENTLYNYNLNEKPKFELSKWIDLNKIINILKTLPLDKLHGNIFVKSI